MNNVKMPLFCDNCECALDYMKDFQYYSQFKACRHCAMKWAEASQEKWLKGWRPNREEVNMYIKERIELLSKTKRIKNDI